MSVLIITEPDDMHAVLVKLALEQKQTDCELFFTADMPSIQKNNIFISNDGCRWVSNDDNQLKHCDVVWWRRPRKPCLPEYIHQEDKIFVENENSIYHSSIPFLLDENAWWVNPICSQQKTKSKIIQLKMAQQCGFLLPKTLISNSPQDIKKFIQNACYNEVIYKPFTPHYWANNEGMRLLYTNKVSLEDLPPDNILQVVPGIYQQYIEKNYELRVTCFGTHIRAVKIDSQNHPLGQTDWRKIPGTELQLSEFELPRSIKEKLTVFMKKMDIVFGCFDFIVTPKGEFIFLELNEQGQFLWVEEILSSSLYLDMFANFLINKKFDFSWKETKHSLRALDFDAEAIKIINTNVNNHVYLNGIKRAA